jgi:hypothetical protein
MSIRTELEQAVFSKKSTEPLEIRMSAKPRAKKQQKQAQPNMADLFGGLLNHAKQGQSNDWWQSYHYPETIEFDPRKLIGCARSALYARAMSEGTVYEIEKDSEEGFVLIQDNLEVLIEALDARLIYSFEQRLLSGLFFVFSDGALYTHFNNLGVRTKFVTLNKKKVELFNKHYHSCVSNEQVETNTN